MAAYRHTRQFSHKIFGWSAVGLALSCSACATVPQTARSKPIEGGPVHAIYTEESKPTSGSLSWAKAGRKEQNSDIQQLNYAEPQAGVIRLHRDSAIQQTANSNVSPPGGNGLTDESASEANLAPVDTLDQPENQAAAIPVAKPATAPARWVSRNTGDVETCPPEPRFPAAGPNPMAAGMMSCDACNLPSPEKFTDEYLCDGGDRDLPVHYDNVFRKGLDTEDTVLEFTDRNGFERMKPTNRVCIYAPRFSSVRTVSSSQEESATDEVAGLGHSTVSSAVHSRLKASNSVKRETTGRMAVRSRASGLETDAFQGVVSALRSPSAHDKLLNIYQSMSFVRFGRLDDADTARLNLGLRAAAAWTREEYPVISAKTDMALEGNFVQSTAVITAIDEKETAENLRIVKLTDKSTASTGDIIEFTIRYDNLGTREVHHIRIVDNLTPRLQYVDDSATSDRAGRLVLQDNGEGSQILVWEMEEPLPGKSGGVVTFKARVR